MEQIGDLKSRMLQERPVEWDDLPDLNLYMDQVVSYLPRQLIHYGEGETLTPAMVNNYIKDGLLPRAQGKKYDRTHLGYLTAICALKPVLSVKEICQLLGACGEGKEPQAMYEMFLGELDGALTETAESLHETVSPEELPRLALGLALRSYADKLACERVLDILAGGSVHE
ncbi:MAG: hypothetical protein H6Q60_1049 [Oscillospiraceae bacterium]|nr:hypothetical protein [Oscillospiraceae bacterium]